MRSKTEATVDSLFLEVADCARILEITPSTVRLYIKGGRLTPVARTPRGIRLFSLTDVENFRRILKKKTGRPQ